MIVNKNTLNTPKMQEKLLKQAFWATSSDSTSVFEEKKIKNIYQEIKTYLRKIVAVTSSVTLIESTGMSRLT